MVQADSALPHMRLCKLVKTHDSQEYGFNLHAEKTRGNFIGHIDESGPAEKAQVRVGDHIIAVNGHSIQGISHQEVVSLIKQDRLCCELLVLDEASLELYAAANVTPGPGPQMEHLVDDLRGDTKLAQNGHEHSNGHGHTTSDTPPSYDTIEPEQSAPAANPVQEAIDRGSVLYHTEGDTEPYTPNPVQAAIQRGLTTHQESPASVLSPSPTHQKTAESGSVAINVVQSTPPSATDAPLPTLCVLKKQTAADEYGFNLHAERNKGHFIGTVDDPSIATEAGLLLGQRIVGINGTLIYPTSKHQDVVDLIRTHPDRVELLVANRATDNHYKEHRQSFSFANAVNPGKHASEFTPVVHETVVEPSAEPCERAPTPPVVHTHTAHVVHDDTDTDRHSHTSQHSNKHSDSVHVMSESVEAGVVVDERAVSMTSSAASNTQYHVSGTPEPEQNGHSAGNTPKRASVASSGKSVDVVVKPVLNGVQPIKHETSNGHSHTNGHDHNQSDTASPAPDSDLDAMFTMTAAQMKAKLASRKRGDARTDTGLSLQEKHRIVTNM